jgi:hypothetical protein
LVILRKAETLDTDQSLSEWTEWSQRRRRLRRVFQAPRLERLNGLVAA